MPPKPFRFAVSAPDVASMREWRDAVRRLEDAGFDTVVVSDHFTGGWQLEPVVALTAAAMVTSAIGLQTGVLCNDYRHPVLTHRMAATLDRLSGGRFTLGLGAGWLLTDYESAGIRLDEPAIRIERLAESVAIIKALFSGKPVDFSGKYYTLRGLVGVPAPSGSGESRPPIMLGGGSPRMLRLAGREADLASMVASLRAGAIVAGSAADLSAERVEKKVAWIRQGMAERHRTEDEVTISINHWLVRVTSTVDEGAAFLARIAARNSLPPELLAESPAVLVGTTDQLVERLQERRQRYGISHFQLDAGFAPSDVESLFPLVSRLAGHV
jgi:probable F420-dependent oxidoreductase